MTFDFPRASGPDRRNTFPITPVRGGFFSAGGGVVNRHLQWSCFKPLINEPADLFLAIHLKPEFVADESDARLAGVVKGSLCVDSTSSAHRDSVNSFSRGCKLGIRFKFHQRSGSAIHFRKTRSGKPPARALFPECALELVGWRYSPVRSIPAVIDRPVIGALLPSSFRAVILVYDADAERASS